MNFWTNRLCHVTLCQWRHVTSRLKLSSSWSEVRFQQHGGRLLLCYKVRTDTLQEYSTTILQYYSTTIPLYCSTTVSYCSQYFSTTVQYWSTDYSSTTSALNRDLSHKQKLGGFSVLMIKYLTVYYFNVFLLNTFFFSFFHLRGSKLWRHSLNVFYLT